MIVGTRVMPEIKPAALSGHVIYMNRCIGGCDLKPGNDDATTTPITSGITQQNATLVQTDLTDTEWNDIVQCVKEVYSPFNVMVTDQKPTAGLAYSQIVVGGTQQMPGASLLGLPAGTGGIAIVSQNCSPDPRGVAFVFGELINVFAQESGGSRVLGTCWTIAQETAHNFGLDHEFDFIDDHASACNDPMTYETDCGGQKFYRNRFASCGVSGGIDGDAPGPRACRCGTSQNSHLKLLQSFGEGTSLIPAPTVSITSPLSGALAGIVNASAGSKRGVGRVELYLNGYKWAETKGAKFGPQGQTNPSTYTLTVPGEVPDSIYDVVVKAYDDLEIVTSSTTVTVTKGAAGGCASAAACLEGQKCEAGKCFWDAPTGEIGDPCTFPQACVSGACSDSTIQGDGICTQSCVVGLADACPMGLECIATGNSGICYLPTAAGCCSTSNSRTPWAPFLLGGLVFGFVMFRRRR